MFEAERWVEKTKAEAPDPEMAFAILARARNESWDASQDLALAAAEHFFYAWKEGRKSPVELLTNVRKVLAYDFLKGLVGPLSLGIGRYALSSNPDYPSSPPTAASVVFGMGGYLWAARDLVSR
jgi:hypothetical protein